MSLTCTRCGGTGFLNTDQLPDEVDGHDQEMVFEWLKSFPENNPDGCHDVGICDCCGDGDGWYSIPGEHYNNDDPQGNEGPYAYNGGLCECN